MADSGSWTPDTVAARIEATMLRPEATPSDVRGLCADAVRYGTRGVCVASTYVPLARQCVMGTPLRVVSVAGFPTGAEATSVKVAEVHAAAESGADEVDVVACFGLMRGGERDAAQADVVAVIEAAAQRDVACKLILETAWLEDEQVRRLCGWAVEAGAGWVKTSTGFGPRGATVDDVALLRAAVGEHARVKAAGGIRSYDQAVALLDAGADALGCSQLAPTLASET